MKPCSCLLFKMYQVFFCGESAFATFVLLLFPIVHRQHRGQRQMHFCIRVIVGSGSPPKPCPRFHAPQLVQRLIFSKRRKKHFHKNFLRASRRNERKNSFSTLYFLLLPFQKVIVGPPPLRTFLSSIARTLHTVFGATICKGQFSILN